MYSAVTLRWRCKALAIVVACLERRAVVSKNQPRRVFPCPWHDVNSQWDTPGFQPALSRVKIRLESSVNSFRPGVVSRVFPEHARSFAGNDLECSVISLSVWTLLFHINRWMPQRGHSSHSQSQLFQSILLPNTSSSNTRSTHRFPTVAFSTWQAD